MEKIYTHQTLLMVTHLQNLLTAAHITAEIRNQYAAGGVGELSSIDAWPELWVTYEDSAVAKRIVKEFERSGEGADWQCQCGEVNGSAFQSCWACSTDRPLLSRP